MNTSRPPWVIIPAFNNPKSLFLSEEKSCVEEFPAFQLVPVIFYSVTQHHQEIYGFILFISHITWLHIWIRSFWAYCSSEQPQLCQSPHMTNASVHPSLSYPFMIFAPLCPHPFCTGKSITRRITVETILSSCQNLVLGCLWFYFDNASLIIQLLNQLSQIQYLFL